MPNHLDHALVYASQGWHVFPVEPPVAGVDSSGKRPLRELGNGGHLQATLDETQIRAWWGARPDASIGISLEPSGLVVLDVDVAGVKQGAASLATIDAQLSRTLTAHTGSGGLHGVYARPAGVEPQRRIGFLPGLDLLGKGYIVAAPSPHYSGGAYRWHDLSAPISPLPPILIAALRGSHAHVGPTGAPPAGDAAPITTGDRNNALFRLGCSLRDTGVGETAVHAALAAENARRFSPPLGDEEVAAVARSVMNRVQPSRDVAAGAIFAEAMRTPLPSRTGSATPADGLPGSASSPSGSTSASPDTAPASIAMLLADVATMPRPPIRSYSTGNAELDAMIGGGVSTRQVFVVCGPPGAGKSGYAVDVALHVSKAIPVLYVSTELERDEVAARFAAARLDAPWVEIVRGRVSAGDSLKDLNVKVIGSDQLPRGEGVLEILVTEIQAMTLEYGVPPLVIVDYLQDLARGTPEQSVRSRIGDLGSSLRAIAQGMDCPMLVVSSVSRSYYGAARMQSMRDADDATVYLAAAKESGDVDYAAATLIFLDVDTVGEGPSRAARLAVAKARHGRTGFAGARFFGASGRWVADPTALVELAAEGRKTKSQERQAAADDTKVIEGVRAGPKSSTELEKYVGGKHDNVRAAVARLLQSGVIVQRRINYVDAAKRIMSKDVLMLTELAPPPPTPIDLNPTKKEGDTS